MLNINYVQDRKWIISELITKNLLLGIFYFLLAKCVEALAIPPGYATAIWPSAGLAFFALWKWGQILWPGILIGSASYNFYVATSVNNQTPLWSHIVMAIIIGSGASLQAIIGSQLCKNYIGKEENIVIEKNLVSLILFAGPISCLISSTIGISSLIGFSQINVDQFLTSWGTWFMGDVIGVLVFTPICLIVFTNYFGEGWKRKSFALSPLVFAFFTSIFIYFFVLKLEKKQITSRYTNNVNQVIFQINQQFNEFTKILKSLESLHYSSDLVTKEEFSDFTNNLFSLSGGVFSVAWAPRVDSKQLDSFIKKYQNLEPDFYVKEKNELGDYTQVADRKFYFPILYSEPRDLDAKDMIGYDLSSQFDRRLAILQSLDRKVIVATSPISFKNESSGIIVFSPIFKNISKPDEQVEGVYLLTLSFADVFKLIDQTLMNQFDDITVEDVTQLDSPKTLYKKNVEKNNFSTDSGIILSQKFGFAERVYEVTTYTSFLSMYKTLSQLLWVSLSFSMLFTGMLGIFVLVLFGRSRLLELEILKASKEMNEQRLKTEEINRFRSLGIMAGGVAHEINNPLMIITGNVSMLVKMLEKEKMDNPKIKDSLNKIVTTVDRISRIVKGLLTLSRDSSQDPIEEVSISRLVDLGTLLLVEKFKAYGIPLRLKGSMNTLIECKIAQMSQVFTIMLQNSIEAIRNMDHSWIEVNVIESSGHVEIEVMDSGSGLSLEVQEKLFTPFFSTKDVGGGTGLGLSIARGVIESHQGKLSYDATSSNTKFVIRMPKRASKN